MQPLLMRIFSRLFARGLLMAKLRTVLRLDRFSGIERPVREFTFEFMHPQGSLLSIRPILRERFDRDFQAHPLESPVVGIEIEVLQTAVNYNGQKNFFHAREEIKERSDAAISQIAEHLGPDRIFLGKYIETVVPERSWTKAKVAPSSYPDFSSHLPERPSRLLRSPLRVQIAQEFIHIGKRKYRITKWSEVEKISADWLDRLVERRYYRLQIEGKPTAWVFQDSSDEYFLHGYFE